MIIVGPDGRRFCDEKFKTRHGKVPKNGVWLPLATPCPMHMIVDHANFSAGPLYDGNPTHGWTQIVEQPEWSADNSAEVAKGWVKKGETLADLATEIGVDAGALEDSVTRWNASAAAGEDAEFGRTLMVEAFGAGPILRGRDVPLHAEHPRRSPPQ